MKRVVVLLSAWAAALLLGGASEARPNKVPAGSGPAPDPNKTFTIDLQVLAGQRPRYLCGIFQNGAQETLLQKVATCDAPSAEPLATPAPSSPAPAGEPHEASGAAIWRPAARADLLREQQGLGKQKGGLARPVPGSPVTPDKVDKRLELALDALLAMADPKAWSGGSPAGARPTTLGIDQTCDAGSGAAKRNACAPEFEGPPLGGKAFVACYSASKWDVPTTVVVEVKAPTRESSGAPGKSDESLPWAVRGVSFDGSIATVFVTGGTPFADDYALVRVTGGNYLPGEAGITTNGRVAVRLVPRCAPAELELPPGPYLSARAKVTLSLPSPLDCHEQEFHDGRLTMLLPTTGGTRRAQELSRNEPVALGPAALGELGP